MTTSGSTLFNLTRNEFIEASLRKLGVLAEGQSANSTQLTTGMQALNVVLSQCLAVGMPLWTRKEYTFALTLATATYTIGVSQTLNTPFPLKINQAILVDTSTYGTLEMEISAIYDYNRLSPGMSSGTPIKLYYQPLVNYGTITIWPTPDANAVANKQIKLIYQRPLEDFTAAGETLDMPKEWHAPIIYKTAVMLAPEYSIPLQDRQTLRAEAKEYMEIAESMGSDNSSVYFVPDHWRT